MTHHPCYKTVSYWTYVLPGYPELCANSKFYFCPLAIRRKGKCHSLWTHNSPNSWRTGIGPCCAPTFLRFGDREIRRSEFLRVKSALCWMEGQTFYRMGPSRDGKLPLSWQAGSHVMLSCLFWFWLNETWVSLFIVAVNDSSEPNGFTYSPLLPLAEKERRENKHNPFFRSRSVPLQQQQPLKPNEHFR